MQTLIIILIYILSPFVAYKISTGVAYDWRIFYSWRKKVKFLKKKPFSCAPCLTFWLTLLFITSTAILTFPGWNLILWVVQNIINVGIAYIVFAAVSCIENHKENLK